jgi:TRAP-type C4-dicarboxylate transport system substrate-binding protein
MLKKAAITFCALIVLSPWQALADATTLRIICFLPARSVSVSKYFIPWMKSVEEASGGTLKMQGYWGGSLGRNPRKQFDLVRDGIADIGLVLPGYTPGKFPDFGVLELPYLARSAEESSVALWRLFEMKLLRGLDTTKTIGFFSTEPNMVHTKKPMKSLADLKGMKIRGAGPVYASTIKHFGAVPIGMPVTQLTESISRGVVDGTLLGWGGALIFRLSGVTGYHYVAPLGTTPALISMNKGKWNSLPAKAKAAIDKFGGEYTAHLGGRGFDNFSRRAAGIIKKKGKRSIVVASAAEIAQQAAAAKPVHDAWIAKTKDGAKKYAALIQILKDIRAGK